MTLPPWEPKTDEEHRAFIERVHDELMAERVKDGYGNADQLDDILFRREAARRGYPIKSSKRGPRFTKSRSSPLEQAKEDAKRLGIVFRRVWKESNRHCDPSRARILAEIWSLSAAEEAELSRHIAGEKSPENGRS